MKRLLAAALALFAAATAQAGPISWDISWTASPAILTAGSSSKIVVTPGSDSGPSDPGEVVSTPAAFFTYSSKATTPDTFTAKAFDLTAKVTDTASGLSQNLTFHLQFDGGLSSSGQSLNLTFPSGDQVTGVLGGHVYHVQLGEFSPPPSYPQNRFVPGVLVASVTAGQVPEPGTLLLAALAAPALGLACRRRRRPAA